MTQGANATTWGRIGNAEIDLGEDLSTMKDDTVQ